MLPEYFAYLTIILGLAGALYYIKNILYGTTRPNIVSWVLWTIAPFIGVYIAYKSGVSGPILFSTFMAGFSPLLVVIASFFKKGVYWKTTPFDIGCGILSAIAIIIWVTTKNGVVALSFAILADLLAGLPTMIKSWNHAETEHIAPYGFGIINQIITFLIIKDFSYLNLAFPIYFVVSNLIIIFEVKRKYVTKIFKFKN
jgi:hypothetical protein